MDFYLNGFRPGDPEVLPADPRRSGADAAELPAEVDVLVVGSGPAGVVLAAQLAHFPGITTRLVERRTGPLEMGQADGIACRSMEMLEAFGLSSRLMHEGYWVNETVFWRPDAADRTRIARSGRIQDVEDGLSEMPHVIMNQARVQELLLGVMRNSPSRLSPDYGLEVADVVTGEPGDHPVRVTLRRVDPERAGEEVTVRARYVVGCDGARSRVRQSIGLELRGDSANQAWGVMDVLAVTDFPDIRFKSVIQSDAGNIVIIPREGDHLVRFYIELDELEPGERVAARGITADRLIEAAREIIHPYSLDVRDVVWWSVYEIGQRLADRFDDAADDGHPRVFIAGDACHTHSPKAGQGMNVSMQDAFNLGWKLAAVLEGRAAPELLQTYSAERQAVAQRLIDFDREWAAEHSARPRDTTAPGGEGGSVGLQRMYTEQGRYTAGVATRYRPSLITAGTAHQSLATGFPVGERFHSAPVVRLSDAKTVQLGHVARADGRWRLYAFADAVDPRDGASRLRGLCDFLAGDDASPVRRSTPAGADVDSVLDLRAVLQPGERDLPLTALPELLRPTKGRFGLVDHGKVFRSDVRGGADVFDLRGIDRDGGCLVVVRPDQYVAHVLPLDAHGALADFFAGFLVADRHLVPAR